jgi:transcriptional regulator with XRE-family HTH domain
VTKRPATVSQKNWQLARHIRKIREAKGLTQEEVADRMRVNTSWVGRIETGRTTPGLKLLGNIARALGVKVKDLEGV